MCSLRAPPSVSMNAADIDYPVCGRVEIDILNPRFGSLRIISRSFHKLAHVNSTQWGPPGHRNAEASGPWHGEQEGVVGCCFRPPPPASITVRP